jgi:hypothetical protein
MDKNNEESQSNVMVFVEKLYGHARLKNLVSTNPVHLRLGDSLSLAQTHLN